MEQKNCISDRIKRTKSVFSMRDYKRALIARVRCYNFIELRSSSKKNITQQEMYEFAGKPLMVTAKAIIRLNTQHPDIRIKSRKDAMNELRKLDPILLNLCYIESFVNYYKNNRCKVQVEELERVLYGEKK